MTSHMATEFGACLSRLRRHRQLSQKALAITAGMDQSYLAGLEGGRRPPPRDRQLQRLMVALQATPEEEQELREARAIFHLRHVADELSPGRGKAIAALAWRLQALPPRQFQLVEEMASLFLQS